MSKYKDKKDKRKKKYYELSFEEKLDLFLKQSKEIQRTMSKRYDRQANFRKIRNKNKDKGDV